MDFLLDYQRIIVQSTYQRNNIEFPNDDKLNKSLRALITRLRADMSGFAKPDQQLLESLLTMIEKDIDEVEEAEGDTNEGKLAQPVPAAMKFAAVFVAFANSGECCHYNLTRL